MVSRPIIIISILLFAFISVKMQCNKDYEPLPEKLYSFNEKVTISPYKLNYLVGDTIWLRVLIPGKMLYDARSNKRMFYDSINFRNYVSLELLYNNPFVNNGPYAAFVFPRGVSGSVNYMDRESLAEIHYGCSPGSDYDLLLGIIPVRKGVFGILFNIPHLTRCFSNEFIPASAYFSFDVADTHKSFYQALPFRDIATRPDERILRMLDQKQAVVINVQ